MKSELVIATLLLLAGGTAMALEEPAYEVLKSTGDYEVRHYEPFIVAEVDIDANAREAGNRAFRILAGYIFGDNAQQEKMKMTAPVASAANSEGGYTYAFVMESKYSLDTLPDPTHPAIRIIEKDPGTIAAHRYSGRWSEANYQNNVQELEDALAEDGIGITGPPMLARYNSPFTPWFARRNEILVEIDWQPEQAAGN